MTRFRYLAVGVCCTLVWTNGADAKPVLLQTVDLSEKAMSTEGGVAKLFRMSSRKGTGCKIEAVHYGEMGKATYVFLFDPNLYSAARRDYSYDSPIFATARAMPRLTKTLSSESAEG